VKFALYLTTTLSSSRKSEAKAPLFLNFYSAVDRDAVSGQIYTRQTGSDAHLEAWSPHSQSGLGDEKQFLPLPGNELWSSSW
jgi:hypothetical protein